MKTKKCGHGNERIEIRQLIILAPQSWISVCRECGHERRLTLDEISAKIREVRKPARKK